jgi:hypothetical protein
VTAGFLQAMQVSLIRGRSFNVDDTAGAAQVALVDEEFARRIWSDRDPIGQRISVNAIPKSNPPVLQWGRSSASSRT